jgi:hypothetical protein
MGLLALVALASCAGGAAVTQPPSPAAAPARPAWARDLESVYPSGRYIAQTGYGATGEAARDAALAAIARYFTSRVEAESGYNSSETQLNGVSTTREYAYDTARVTSQVELAAVRYTEPWRDADAGNYVCAAYLDRDEAWTVYEPRLRSVTGPFTAAYQAAEAAGDPLRQAYRYPAAARMATADTLAALDFAQILAPDKAKAYDDARRAIAGAAQKGADAKARTALVIHCEDDIDGIIAGAITAAFSGGGFRVTRDEALSTNWAEAVIDGGKQTLEAGTFYTPRLTVTVYGAGGAIFTWTASAARQGARDPAIAQRRAWTALAEEVKRGLWAAFDTEMGKD